MTRHSLVRDQVKRVFDTWKQCRLIETSPSAEELVNEVRIRMQYMDFVEPFWRAVLGSYMLQATPELIEPVTEWQSTPMECGYWQKIALDMGEIYCDKAVRCAISHPSAGRASYYLGCMALKTARSSSWVDRQSTSVSFQAAREAHAIVFGVEISFTSGMFSRLFDILQTVVADLLCQRPPLCLSDGFDPEKEASGFSPRHEEVIYYCSGYLLSSTWKFGFRKNIDSFVNFVANMTLCGGYAEAMDLKLPAELVNVRNKGSLLFPKAEFYHFIRVLEVGFVQFFTAKQQLLASGALLPKLAAQAVFSHPVTKTFWDRCCSGLSQSFEAEEVSALFDHISTVFLHLRALRDYAPNQRVSPSQTEASRIIGAKAKERGGYYF